MFIFHDKTPEHVKEAVKNGITNSSTSPNLNAYFTKPANEPGELSAK